MEIEYELLRSSGRRGLGIEVTKYLREGWKLYGNPIIGTEKVDDEYDPYGKKSIEKNFYYQAVIRPGETNND